MQKYLIDKNWNYFESNLKNLLFVSFSEGWRSATLPHDYSMEKERSKTVPGGQEEGFTQGAGIYYKKTIDISKESAGKRFWLEFEGISGITQIWVNKKLMAKHMNPYTGFWHEITEAVHVGENEILVYTDSRLKPGSRWYVGTGIYRHVWMHVGEKAAVRPNTLHVTTKGLNDGHATVRVEAQIDNASGDDCDAKVFYSILDADGREISCMKQMINLSDPITDIHADLLLENITAWCPETPYLYIARVIVDVDGAADTAQCRIGLRMIKVDSKDGFKLNGKPMKLKGGCIHHDLGILGAASHDAAEYWRVKLLKENGYNALRLSHNPFSPNFLDVCDELGILVIEEAFDEWVLGRVSFGYHMMFESQWEADLEAMVCRDYNHPCIIMWSTGNEVEERDGSADGYMWSRKLSEKVRSLDASRPVSATACSLPIEYLKRPDKKNNAAGGTTGNQALNMAYDNFASGEDLWGDATAPYFEPLDVAGYNYKTVRYAHDREKFPDRVIYGSESYPRAAFQSWQATEENPNVIGDFVWTAMDYIGEIGVGRWETSDAFRPADPGWPWMLAHCGDIDLIGDKRPQSHYRDVVWQRDTVPHLFVLPPELTGKNIARLSWAWLPVEPNYTYPGCEGQDIEIHVYANADEIEIFQNGESLGRRLSGKEQEYTTVFTVPYEPGTLKAISYRNGTPCGSDTLVTAGNTVELRLIPDRRTIKADGMDLCFVTIRALDEHGTPVFNESNTVTLKLQGGELLAIGNADPKPDRLIPYGSDTIPLFNGAALAVIRSMEDASGCKLTADMENGLTAELFLEYNSSEII